MTKKILLLLVLLLSVGGLMSQEYVRPGEQPNAPVIHARRFSLGVSLGSAIPVRDFGSTNVRGAFWDGNSTDSTRLQGFAKAGFHFNVMASYLITDNIGIMCMFGSSYNAFDLNTFSSTIGFNTYSPAGTYNLQEYLIGPFFSYPYKRKSFKNASNQAFLNAYDAEVCLLSFSFFTNFSKLLFIYRVIIVRMEKIHFPFIKRIFVIHGRLIAEKSSYVYNSIHTFYGRS